MPDWDDLHIAVQDHRVTVTVGDRSYSGPSLALPVLEELQVLRTTKTPRDYGGQLFDALFVDELREAYDAVAVSNRQWHIHLTVDSSSPQLDSVWWEALTAKGPPPTYLGHSYRTPFSRKLSVPVRNPAAIATRDERIKVLVVIANPTDLEDPAWGLCRLDEEAIIESVKAALGPLDDRISFDIQTTPASAGRIRDRLSAEGIHVLHILGHTIRAEGGAGVFVLEDDDETAIGVGDEELAELAMDLRDLRLVVLSSCQRDAPSPAGGSPSGQTSSDVLVRLAPRMIEYGVPAVVAMQDIVELESARLFTAKFYEALARSKTGMIDEALNRVRESLFYRRREQWDWAVPVLFMAGDGILFEPSLPDAPKAAVATPRRSPAPLSVVADTSPGPVHPVVRGGKPTPPGNAGGGRTRLIDALRRLNPSPEEMDTLCRALRAEAAEVEAGTDEERFRKLVDLAVNRNAADALETQMRAVFKIRQGQRKPTISSESQAVAAKLYAVDSQPTIRRAL